MIVLIMHIYYLIYWFYNILLHIHETTITKHYPPLNSSQFQVWFCCFFSSLLLPILLLWPASYTPNLLFVINMFSSCVAVSNQKDECIVCHVICIAIFPCDEPKWGAPICIRHSLVLVRLKDVDTATNAPISCYCIRRSSDTRWRGYMK